jgi:hypothetical protein
VESEEGQYHGSHGLHQVINDQIPAAKVYEDEHTIAFMDVRSGEPWSRDCGHDEAGENSHPVPGIALDGVTAYLRQQRLFGVAHGHST